MERRALVAGLRTGWWLAVVGLAVGVGVALGLSLTRTPVYSASTQLFVSATDNSSPAAVFQGSQFTQDRISSYADLVAGKDVAQRVIRRLGVDLTPDQLSAEISAAPVSGTVLLNVTVTDASAERAAALANAVAAEFSGYAAELEAAGAGGVSPVKVTVTETTSPPGAPSAPKTTRNAILGGLVGCLAGVAVLIVRVRLDRTAKDPEEVSQLVAAPLMGSVLRDAALEKRHTIDSTPGSRTAEDYRQLRTNLQYLKVDEPPRVIMVTSAVPSEGKTTLVINLAMVLADAGKSVTVVEADLRRPKVTRYLGMVSGVGLTNVLAGTAKLSEVVQVARNGVTVVPAGPTPPNPGELLASSHMLDLLEDLRVQTDYVLIDAPPLLPVADATGLAVHTDGILLSVRYGSTRKDQVRQAALRVQRVGAATLGVVLNIVPPKAELAQAYGYGYNYSYEGDGSSSSSQSPRVVPHADER